MTAITKITPWDPGTDEYAPEYTEGAFLMLIALVLLWYGTITAYCLTNCGGWGNVKECSTTWYGYAKVVCKD